MADGIKVRILGQKDFEKSLEKKTMAILKAEHKAVAESSRLVHATAVRSIMHEGSYIEYVSKKNGRSHWSSQPGTPPSSDTGNLANLTSVDAPERRGNTWIAIIRSQAFYASWLEFGTRNMEKRPFMGPALIKNAKKIKGLIRKALNLGNQK